MPRQDTLTKRQRDFIEAYLTNGQVALQAYRSAFTSKASDKNVASEASKLLRNPKVAAEIARAEAKAQKATRKVVDQYAVTQERITRELALIGFANMADYMTVGSDGDPFLDFSKLSRDQAAALTEVIVEDFKDGRGEFARDIRRIKFKLADKRAALVDLGKTLSMFKERVEHSTFDGKPLVQVYLPGNSRDGT